MSISRPSAVRPPGIASVARSEKLHIACFWTRVLDRPTMSSLGDMFSRRAAASESSFARDDAKRSLQRLNERQEKLLLEQTEKVDDLRVLRDSTINSAVRNALNTKLEREQQRLEDLHAQTAKMARLTAGQAQYSDSTVDVLAEISAHSLPLGRASAHLADPVVYDNSVAPPDLTAPMPKLPSQAAVASEIYRDSPMS